MNWVWLACFASLFWSNCHALIDAEEVTLLKDDKGFIKVSDENYDIVSRGIRDHFTILYVMISDGNSMNIQCDICHEMESTLSTVMDIMGKQAPDTKVLIFEADVEENRKLVDDMDITSIPHVLVFPPPSDSTFRWSVDSFYQYPITVDELQRVLHFGNFLGQIVGVHLEISDFNYTEFYKYFIGSIIIFLFIKKQILPRVPNFKKWVTVAVSFAILLTSICGYKFTEMNSIPFIARNGDDGKIMYFSGGMGWQFGIEIFTVSAMYAAMAALAVILILTPRLPMSSTLKDVQGITVSCFLFVVFSYYTKCYEVKLPEYPFEF